MTPRRFEDAGLGARFEVDDAFAAATAPATPAGLPQNVRSACLARSDATGQAVLSIARVEAGYETSPQEVAEQLVIHNRFTAHTAEQRGWTIHSPWKATMLAGYPAMHCDYVVPASAGRAARDEPAPQALPLAGSDVEAGPPGHVQAWVAYVGPVTWQVMLGVDPPGDLDANRRVMDQVTRTFELLEPAG
jgi:hypothetical protein